MNLQKRLIVAVTLGMAWAPFETATHATELTVSDVLASHVVGHSVSNLPHSIQRTASEVGGAYFREGVSANSTRAEVSSWILNTSKTDKGILETEQYASTSKSGLLSHPNPIVMSAHINSSIEWTVPALGQLEAITWTPRLSYRIVDGVTLHRAAVENVTQSLILFESTNLSSLGAGGVLDIAAGDVIRVSFDATVERSFPSYSREAGNQLTFRNRFEVVATATLGDFDGDGVVARGDLDRWVTGFGPNDSADANGDGVSDGADLLTWQRHLGSGGSIASAVASVPEPDAAIIFSLAIAGAIRCRRCPAV